MTNATRQLAHDSVRGNRALHTITDAAAEIGQRVERLANATGAARDRLTGEISDLMDTLSRGQPRNARECVAGLAMLVGVLHDLDELGSYRHELAKRMAAQLLDGMEALSRVSAADLGVAAFAARRHAPPAFTPDHANAAYVEALDQGARLHAAGRWPLAPLQPPLPDPPELRRVCPV